MEANSAAIWLNTVFADFDLAITQFIVGLFLPNKEFFTPFFEGVSFIAHDGIPLIILGFILCFFRKTRKVGTAMLLAMGVGALITNCVLKVLIARPRPYTELDSFYHEIWLIVGQNTESDKSFPSGHTTAAFATVVSVFLVTDKKKSWPIFLFGFLMGIARIYLCVHYATDVIAGALVGTFGGFMGPEIAAKLPEKHYGGVPFRYTKFIDLGLKEYIQDKEHHYDYINAPKLSRFAFGDLKLYWTDLSKKYCCDYSYVDGISGKIVECAEDEFSQNYSYYRIILKHEGNEIANLIVNKESEAQQVMNTIRQRCAIAA